MGNLYGFFSFQQAFINPININKSHMCASREEANGPFVSASMCLTAENEMKKKLLVNHELQSQ